MSPFIWFEMEEIKSPLIAVVRQRMLKRCGWSFFRFFLTKGGCFQACVVVVGGKFRSEPGVGGRRDQDLLKRDRGHGTGKQQQEQQQQQ